MRRSSSRTRSRSRSRSIRRRRMSRSRRRSRRRSNSSSSNSTSIRRRRMRRSSSSTSRRSGSRVRELDDFQDVVASGLGRDGLGEGNSDMGDVRFAFYPSRSASFHVFPGQSRRGTDVLVVGGFKYTRRSGNSLIWRCSSRGIGCKASVRFDSTTSGSSPCPRGEPHNHAPDNSATDILVLVGNRKNAACSNPLRPAMSIIEEELLKFRDRIPYGTLPHLNVLRSINRARALMRPPSLSTLVSTCCCQQLMQNIFSLQTCVARGTVISSSVLRNNSVTWRPPVTGF